MNEKFKKVRLSKGMRVVELAGRSGISVSYIDRLDTGWTLPSYEVAEKLAVVLECSVDEIFPVDKLKRRK